MQIAQLMQFRSGTQVERMDGVRGVVLGVYELQLIVHWVDNQLGQYHLVTELPPNYIRLV
jgi:hypothetical protein